MLCFVHVYGGGDGEGEGGGGEEGTVVGGGLGEGQLGAEVGMVYDGVECGIREDLICIVLNEMEREAWEEREEREEREEMQE